jgi:hypothetical protein
MTTATIKAATQAALMDRVLDYFEEFPPAYCDTRVTPEFLYPSTGRLVPQWDHSTEQWYVVVARRGDCD